MAAGVAIAGLAAVGAIVVGWPAMAREPGATGLPIPRFASLKSETVNVRIGPGGDYRIAWVFRRAGLPVEIIAEFEGWRQLRDADGATGWVLGAMLSGRRTALVAPWDGRSGGAAAGGTTRVPVPLRDGDTATAAILAELEPGVLATIATCDGRWCRIAVDGFKGWVEQTRLWGVYEGEVVR